MEEMKNQVEEAPQMTEEEQTQMANEALVNMLSQIFSKEKIEEFRQRLEAIE